MEVETASSTELNTIETNAEASTNNMQEYENEIIIILLIQYTL